MPTNVPVPPALLSAAVDRAAASMPADESTEPRTKTAGSPTADNSTADSPGAGNDAEVAARLRLSVTRLARRLRQESGAGLTPSQLSALAVVDNRGPLTLGSLAELERVAPPSITKLVAKLVADDLVVRTVDQLDRRIVLVATTERGAALMAESRRRKTAWLASRLAQLDHDQQLRLTAALDVLDVLVRAEDPS